MLVLVENTEFCYIYTMKQTLFFCLCLFFFHLMAAQHPSGGGLVTINRNAGLYLHRYQALARDTSVLEGNYEMLYKNKTMERGCYHNNRRVGVWQFFNLDNALEFCYDFDDGKASRYVIPEDGVFDVPCLFLGSPLIPHFFLVQRLYYPSSEYDSTVEQEVQVALRINKEGKLTGTRLVKNASARLDETVLKAASQMPSHWQWLPAQINNMPVESDYIIKIIFEPAKQAAPAQ